MSAQLQQMQPLHYRQRARLYAFRVFRLTALERLVSHLLYERVLHRRCHRLNQGQWERLGLLVAVLLLGLRAVAGLLQLRP